MATIQLQVFAADGGVLVDGAPGSSDDFRLGPGYDTLELISAQRQVMTITDNDGDVELSNDAIQNERSDDRNQQITQILGTTDNVYQDYSVTLTDGTQQYEVFVIDVRDSPNASLVANQAVTYIGYSASNPPPFDVTLEVVRVNLGRGPSLYSDLACFTVGTLIETAEGPRPVESLRPGDLVRTADHGLQPVRWAGRRKLSAYDLMLNPRMRPVTIRAGAMGPGLPARDLTVSPEHRVLVKGPRVELMFGEAEMLCPAKALVDGTAIRQSLPEAGVEYVHIMFDAHEVVLSEGLPTESFLVGARALEILPDAEAEIRALFPELDAGRGMAPARALMRPYEAAALAR